jgi:hypothetical protein
MRIKKIHIADFPLFILFLGFVSTLGGAIWTLLYTVHLKKTCISYYNAIEQSIEELIFAAIFHVLLAIIIHFDIKRRENG